MRKVGYPLFLGIMAITGWGFNSFLIIRSFISFLNGRDHVLDIMTFGETFFGFGEGWIEIWLMPLFTIACVIFTIKGVKKLDKQDD